MNILYCSPCNLRTSGVYRRGQDQRSCPLCSSVALVCIPRPRNLSNGMFGCVAISDPTGMFSSVSGDISSEIFRCVKCDFKTSGVYRNGDSHRTCPVCSRALLLCPKCIQGLSFTRGEDGKHRCDACQHVQHIPLEELIICQR